MIDALVPGRRSRVVAAALVGVTFLLGACAREPASPAKLVVLAGRDVDGLDPHAAGALWQTQSLLSNVYETLITVDPSMTLVPQLAVSWSNPSETSWEFQLRPRIPFHSGGVLRSEDVVFSILRARDHPKSILREALADVVEARALVGDRVRIEMRHPDAFLCARLRDVYIASQACVEQKGDAGFDGGSCGTGFYRVLSRKPGTSIALASFAEHWGAVASITNVVVVPRRYGDPLAAPFITPGSRLLFGAEPIPGGPLLQRASKEADAHPQPSLTITYLGFDLHGAETSGVRLPGGGRTNPFLDRRVREAIDLAIDRKAVLSSQRGLGFVPTQLIPPSVLGFDPALRAAPADRVRARALLRETPYPDGFGVDLVVRDLMNSFAEPVVEGLAAIGIRANVRSLPEDAYFKALDAHEGSLYILRFSCRGADAQEFLDRWVHTADRRMGYGEINYSYDACPVPELDAEIEGARRELDAASRNSRLRSVMARVTAERLAIPILHPSDCAYTSKDLAWTPRADGYWHFATARFQ
ncbi:MAG: ABC transporter substrate-binding protein [Thermoanaerobaculia bacterium]